MDCVCGNIRKVSRALTQIYIRFLGPSGLRVTQYSLLINIERLEKATVTKLVQRMLMDKTTLTRNLRLLSEKGLVSIKPGKDRRVREITLTGSGKEALEQARPRWEETQAWAVRRLGKKRVDRLIGDLSELMTSMDR
jgi:DNA-binding MarR family transcriptional regulator